MEIPEQELEIRLRDIGTKILSPPQLDSELLDTLNSVENLLARVEQSPSDPLREAIIPITKALVAEAILRHSDVDIKVAVASCISEITRISAPDSPYEDEEMKEVFQLIVSSFENLDDKSNRSYTRRISILETLAKVRSCVVMLDLECDDLIVEMVRLFFRTIRDDHHDSVFSSMKTIMTLVLEESEDIPVNLLSQFLNILKKDNEEVLPVARQLAEEVFAVCGSIIKPYLLPAVRASDAFLEDYSKAVADVFRVGDEAVEPAGDAANEIPQAEEDKLVNVPSEMADEVAMETMEDAPLSEEAGPIVAPPATVATNGVLNKGNEDAPATNDGIKDADSVTQHERAKPSKTRLNSVADEEPATSNKTKPKKANRRKAKKPSSTKGSLEPFEPVLPNSQKEVAITPEHHENDDKNVDDMLIEDPKVDTTSAACNEKQSKVPVPSPATLEKAYADIPSPSPSGSLDEIRPEKNGQGKGKGRPLGEDKSASDVASKEAAVLEQPTLKKHASKKSSFASVKEESLPNSSDHKKKDDDNMNEVDVTLAKNLVQEAVVGAKPVKKKTQSQAKVIPAKGHAKTASKDGVKKTVALLKSTPKATKDTEEAPKTSSKRKHPDEGKTPIYMGYGPELVGSRVEVWWPDDKKFYKGIVQSYIAAAKFHKVCYDDGDVEVLNLNNEKWNSLDDFEGHTFDGGYLLESAGETPKGKKAKTNADIGTSKGKNTSSTKTPKATSSKSKVTPKSGSKDDGKVAGKSKEEAASKKGAKSDVDKIEKSKASKSGNKPSEETPKSDGDKTEKFKASKSKDTPKSAAKSKGKSQKSAGKSNSTAATIQDLPPTIDIKDSEDEPIETERMPEVSKPEKSSNKRKRIPKE